MKPFIIIDNVGIRMYKSDEEIIQQIKEQKRIEKMRDSNLFPSPKIKDEVQ